MKINPKQNKSNIICNSNQGRVNGNIFEISLVIKNSSSEIKDLPHRFYEIRAQVSFSM